MYCLLRFHLALRKRKRETRISYCVIAGQLVLTCCTFCQVTVVIDEDRLGRVELQVILQGQCSTPEEEGHVSLC